MAEQVVLVDEAGRAVGRGEKERVHREGLLHRAFSIFVFNPPGQLLLQRRAPDKYHSGGLWSNTCCSHPRPDELMDESVHRRLQEEMGFDCALRSAFQFTYRAQLPNNLIEHEFDHVYVGVFRGSPVLNVQEATDYKWVSLSWLEQDLMEDAERYTYWLRHCFGSLLAYLEAEPGVLRQLGLAH